jgi:hypothetical protein
MNSDWIVPVDGLDFWEKKHSFAFAVNGNLDTPAYIMVTTLTELFRPPQNRYNHVETKNKQDRQYKHNVILMRVRTIIVAVDIQ